MNARDTTHEPTDWTTANQRLLSAEFARIKARLRGEDEAVAQARITQCRLELDESAAIDQLVERFGLSGFERDTVVRIERLLHIAEYKRRQAPPGVKLGTRNFGRDRRYPITNAFRSA